MNYKILLIALASILFSMSIVAIARCTPGVSVTVIEIDSLITSPGDAATYMVNVENSAGEDLNVRLTITAADPNLGFNWTTQELTLADGATESFGLKATYSGTTPGDFEFKVTEEDWPIYFASYDEAFDLGAIAESFFIDYVYVTPSGVIPEVPLGTIMASASMIVALVAYITVPRFRKNQRHTT